MRSTFDGHRTKNATIELTFFPRVQRAVCFGLLVVVVVAVIFTVVNRLVGSVCSDHRPRNKTWRSFRADSRNRISAAAPSHDDDDGVIIAHTNIPLKIYTTFAVCASISVTAVQVSMSRPVPAQMHVAMRVRSCKYLCF